MNKVHIEFSKTTWYLFNRTIIKIAVCPNPQSCNLLFNSSMMSYQSAALAYKSCSPEDVLEAKHEAKMIIPTNCKSYPEG